MIINEDYRYYIWLSKIFGEASTTASKLFSYFDSDIFSVYDADENELRSIPWLNNNAIERMLNDKDLSECDNIIAYCEYNDVCLLTPEDDKYPKRLLELKDKPMTLYCKGNVFDLNDVFCIGCVGTRSMSNYGRNNAYTISYDLSRSGAVIISGMAYGCDSVCHRATLDSGGKTIAVLGCGIDIVYPPVHEELMEEIIKYGCVVTEYSPGTPPNRYNFPKRNRIISGMSDAVLVVEAPLSSGSLITAKYAEKQGKKVYALPGKVGETNSSGTNDLIQNGASMILKASDIVHDFTDKYPDTLMYLNPKYEEYHMSVSSPVPDIYENKKSTIPKSYIQKERRSRIYTDDAEPEQVMRNNCPPNKRQSAFELTGNQKKVYETVLLNNTVSTDELIRQTEISPTEISVILTVLEIKKLIKKLPGDNYAPEDE